MKNTELRIGNIISVAYVGAEGKEWKQYPAELKDIIDIEHHPENYQYVEITGEWLLKFGFAETTRYGEEKIYNRQIFEYSTMHKEITLEIEGVEDCISYDTGVKYVHQLQNLYFALKEEELTVKTETT